MKVLTLPIILFFTLTLFANPPTLTRDQQGFIETYAPMAVAEMQKSGIPASIKLAQAILESSWGQGTIAVQGNNFFGIKCNNSWEGQCVKWMDDEVDLSDFRAYDNVEESFRDHSDFLTNNIRYHPLFDIPVSDYRNWAYGLRQCGYATDSQYAMKLIRLIEEQGLYLYDNALLSQQFQILNTRPETQKVEVGPNWEVQSFRPDEFTLLSTVRFGPELVEMVMTAPSYKLDDEVTLVAPDLEAVTASLQGKKIRPIFPLPEYR